jgi:hypothetical protein
MKSHLTGLPFAFCTLHFFFVFRAYAALRKHFLGRHALEEQIMLTLRKQLVALFVDRQSQQWVVRDPEGNFWLVPSVENPWDHRQPFQPADEAGLEPVPGHYKDMLGLPF